MVHYVKPIQEKVFFKGVILWSGDMVTNIMVRCTGWFLWIIIGRRNVKLQCVRDVWMWSMVIVGDANCGSAA